MGYPADRFRANAGRLLRDSEGAAVTSVVGGIDDDGVVGQLGLFQKIEHQPHRVVDVRYAAQVTVPQTLRSGQKIVRLQGPVERAEIIVSSAEMGRTSRWVLVERWRQC